jgi:quinol monooxygenase YgiN
VPLYEIYDDKAAFATHQSMAHYKKFKETTADMIVQMDVIKMRGSS